MKLKKIGAISLALCMALTLCSVSVSADESETTTTTTEVTTEEATQVEDVTTDEVIDSEENIIDTLVEENVNVAATSSAKLDQVPEVFTSSRTSSSLSLTWEAVDGADGYEIEKYLTSTQAYVIIGTTDINKYEVSGLRGATDYQFRARAYKETSNGYVYGKYSDVISTTTAPKSVDGVKFRSYGTTSVELAWNWIPSASGYEIDRYNTKTKKFEYYKRTTNNSISIASLTKSTSYKYRVRAYKTTDAGRVYGTYSQTFTGSTAPSKVTDFKVSSTSPNSIKLKWKASKGATGYQVQKYDAASKKYVAVKNVTGTSCTVSDLKAKSSYKFRVRPYRTVNSVKYYGSNTSAITAKTPGLYTSSDLRLMTSIIYCEAQTEPYATKVAVGIVVMNRVKSKLYPSTIKKVLYQKWQFSPIHEGSFARALKLYDKGYFDNKANYKACKTAAKEALSGAQSVTYKGKTYNMKGVLGFALYVRHYKFKIGVTEFK